MSLKHPQNWDYLHLSTIWFWIIKNSQGGCFHALISAVGKWFNVNPILVVISRLKQDYCVLKFKEGNQSRYSDIEICKKETAWIWMFPWRWGRMLQQVLEWWTEKVKFLWLASRWKNAYCGLPLYSSPFYARHNPRSCVGRGHLLSQQRLRSNGGDFVHWLPMLIMCVAWLGKSSWSSSLQTSIQGVASIGFCSFQRCPWYAIS